MDKDIMNLPGTKFGLPCTQEELMAFERRHREYMYELQRKRVIILLICAILSTHVSNSFFLVGFIGRM